MLGKGPSLEGKGRLRRKNLRKLTADFSLCRCSFGNIPEGVRENFRGRTLRDSFSFHFVAGKKKPLRPSEESGLSDFRTSAGQEVPQNS